jgi:tetratricopeptide (TPR) repeat protein
MSDLPDDLSEEVQRLCAEGDELADQQRYEEALSRYEAAWALLPEPRTDWATAIWILAAIGDAHFHRGDFASGRRALMEAMIRGDGANGNPFLRLRLGQCMYEMGAMKEAANWLTGAYLMEGRAIFAEDSPKYLEFIKSQLEPPPGGWPEGW